MGLSAQAVNREASFFDAAPLRGCEDHRNRYGDAMMMSVEPLV